MAAQRNSLWNLFRCLRLSFFVNDFSTRNKSSPDIWNRNYNATNGTRHKFINAFLWTLFSLYFNPKKNNERNRTSSCPFASFAKAETHTSCEGENKTKSTTAKNTERERISFSKEAQSKCLTRVTAPTWFLAAAMNMYVYIHFCLFTVCRCVEETKLPLKNGRNIDLGFEDGTSIKYLLWITSAKIAFSAHFNRAQPNRFASIHFPWYLSIPFGILNRNSLLGKNWLHKTIIQQNAHVENCDETEGRKPNMHDE